MIPDCKGKPQFFQAWMVTAKLVITETGSVFRKNLVIIRFNETQRNGRKINAIERERVNVIIV